MYMKIARPLNNLLVSHCTSKKEREDKEEERTESLHLAGMSTSCISHPENWVAELSDGSG